MNRFFIISAFLFLVLSFLSLYPVYDAIEAGIIPGTGSWFQHIDLWEFYK